MCTTSPSLYLSILLPSLHLFILFTSSLLSSPFLFWYLLPLFTITHILSSLKPTPAYTTLPYTSTLLHTSTLAHLTYTPRTSHSHPAPPHISHQNIHSTHNTQYPTPYTPHVIIHHYTPHYLSSSHHPTPTPHITSIDHLSAPTHHHLRNTPKPYRHTDLHSLLYH